MWDLQFLVVKLHILVVKCCDFYNFTAYSSGEIRYIHRLKKCQKDIVILSLLPINFTADLTQF